jgi:hypothetical protein
MTEATLSVARGFSAASGVAATFAYPWLQRRAGNLQSIWCGVPLALTMQCGLCDSMTPVSTLATCSGSFLFLRWHSAHDSEFCKRRLGPQCGSC